MNESISDLPGSVATSPIQRIAKDVYSGRALFVVVFVFGLASLPALLGSQAITEVSSMYSLGASEHPYFQPSYAGLLYIITPIIVVSSFVLFLSPGLLWVMAFNQARNLAEWVSLSFGISLGFLILFGTVFKLASNAPLNLPVLSTIWFVFSIFAVIFLWYRQKTGIQIVKPLNNRADARRLIWLIIVTFVSIVVFLPKLFWENFNLDGIEAFEFGRSLSIHILPNWEVHEGVFGFYQNFLLFAYPNHWFISLFGPVEAAARIPFFLYLIVLFCALISLIELGKKQLMSGFEEAVLWLGLGLFVIIQGFNVTYEPFFADFSESAATDTLWVTCFLLACFALWSGRVWWFCLFGLMTYTASAGGLLLLGSLTIATIISRSSGWRKEIRIVGGLVLACLMFGIIYETLYLPLILGGIKDQFSSVNLLKRLFPPNFTEFVRFNALIFPSGILPAIALATARPKDPVSWKLAWITLIYFAVIYLQAWTGFHQFTPIMVLPLVVFWRFYLSQEQRVKRMLLPTLVITTMVALILSLPRHFKINGANRQIGLATDYRIGDYETNYEQALRAGSSLYALFPEDYRLKYPEQPWSTDPEVWIYYSMREKMAGTKINYVIQLSSEPPPAKAELIMRKGDISVYIFDKTQWKRDRDRDLPKVVVSPIYEPILRNTFSFFREYVGSVENS